MGGLPFVKIINTHSCRGYAGLWGLSLHTVSKIRLSENICNHEMCPGFQLEGDTETRCLHLALQAASFASVASLQLELNTCPDRLTASAVCVCVIMSVFLWVCVCVFEGLTLAVAQVLDLDAFLLLTGRLLYLAGVVIGTAVWGAHRVEADVGTVDVANTPAKHENHIRAVKKTPKKQKKNVLAFYVLVVLSSKINEIWNINENESIFIPQRLLCVCVCFTVRDGDWKFAQGLKMRQEKKKKPTTYRLHSVRMLDHAW